MAIPVSTSSLQLVGLDRVPSCRITTSYPILPSEDLLGVNGSLIFITSSPDNFLGTVQ